MAAPKDFEQYHKWMMLNRVLIASTIKKPVVPKFNTKTAWLSYRFSPSDIYTPKFKGDAWDYDESWIIYKHSPKDAAFLSRHLFPRDYFLAEQAYVAKALKSKLSSSASIRDKALWAIDILYHINNGLLATNLHAEVQGDLTLINEINAVTEEKDLDDLDINLKDTNIALKRTAMGETTSGTQYIWEYTLATWERHRRDPTICPLMCKEFSDLLLLPAVMSAEALTSVYGPSRNVPSIGIYSASAFSQPVAPYYSWQAGGRDVVTAMPWIKNGVGMSRLDMYLRLFGSSFAPVMNALQIGLKVAPPGYVEAHDQWMFLNVYRLDKWYLNTALKSYAWLYAGDKRIPETRRFKPLSEFLKSLESKPAIQEAIVGDLGLKGDRRKIRVPNFAYMYEHGAIDAWAKYFIALGYREYIEAGAHMWGQALGDAKNPSTTASMMQRAYKEKLFAPEDISTTTAAIASLSVEVGAKVLSTVAAVIATGAVVGIGTMGVGAVVAGVIAVFSTILGSHAKKRAKRRLIYKHREQLVGNHRVITQLFIRTVPEKFMGGPFDQYSFSTDTGQLSIADGGLSPDSAVKRVARAISILLPSIRKDDDKPSWAIAKLDRALPPREQKPDLAALLEIFKEKYDPKHPNLFKNVKTGKRVWVNGETATKLRKDPGWAFVRKQLAAKKSSPPPVDKTSGQRRVAAVAVAVAAAAAAVFFGWI